VILFHLMAPNEMNLDDAATSTLEDWETGQAVEVAADQVAAPTYKPCKPT
jgi:hypothetical protein